jgi:hypothetical protein
MALAEALTISPLPIELKGTAHRYEGNLWTEAFGPSPFRFPAASGLALKSRIGCCDQFAAFAPQWEATRRLRHLSCEFYAVGA